ncbi:unnamed protein product [Adineta ricciae]|uniref:Uncharacterized protein n=1 Tax=Adineta ricciae TaxID=249248 RepID=A0A814ZRC0_ADIRI|nr:unnamed protein product [Adineta ricciae]
MHPQQPLPGRRSKRTVQRPEQLNTFSGDSSDSSASPHVTSDSRETGGNTLPPRIVSSASITLMNPDQSTTATQTTQENPTNLSFQSKSVPSFAETQLLSIYYPNRTNPEQSTVNTNQDNRVFVEQQDRQPIRFRATYDPSASVKFTQTSHPVSLSQLSTHGSTLVVGNNQQTTNSENLVYEQRLKIHSGSQRLANNPSSLVDTDELLPPNELVEESRYSYEEYIIHVDNNQEQAKQISSSSPTSTSSATTIIAQSSPSQQPVLPPSAPPQVLPRPKTSQTMLHPDDLDSDRTSRLSGDEINTHSTVSSMSGSFTNQDWAATTNTPSRSGHEAPLVNPRQSITTHTTEETTRISSWPPVPYDIQTGDGHLETSFILDDSDDQRRPSRVQFAEELVRVIPPSATNSLSEEYTSSEARSSSLSNNIAPAIVPRTSTTRRLSYEQAEQQTNVDTEEDDSVVTTTTSSSKGPVVGRLQRASGLANLNEETMSRPTNAPPPPPPPPPSHSAPPSSSQPPSQTTSTAGVDPRLVREQLQRLDYQLVVDTRPPINQSKWVKDHMDTSDVQSTTTSGRVGALRSLFEQQSGRSSDSSTLNSPTGQNKRTEPEERPSRHGDEIRFRIKQPKTPSVQQAEPVKAAPRTKQPTADTSNVAPMTWEDLVGAQEEERQQQKQSHSQGSSSSLDVDEIQQIIGKRIKSVNDIGYYSSDGRTWKWDDTFWFGLTATQRDQLHRLQQHSRSRQDSGDTQINEYSDRSAYQGDSEDNTPRNISHDRRVRPRTSSQDLTISSSGNRTPTEEIKRFNPTENDPGSTVSITGAGAWQQQRQPPTVSTGIGRYTETSTVHESQPSVSVFGSTPTATYTRVGSQESLASSTAQQRPEQPQSLTPQSQQQQQPQQQYQPIVTKRTDSQMTVIESGYSSADEPQQQQQRTQQFRPNSSTIIEEPSVPHHPDTSSGVAGLIAVAGSILVPSNDVQLQEQPIYENLRPGAREQMNEPELDPLSYEQFIYDYFSSNARRLRSDDGTLILLIDGQQIQMSHIRLPSNDHITLAQNVYLDAIDEYPPPFETESDQLIIFVHGEPIVIPADKWLVYKKKYQKAQWVEHLDQVNRRIPAQLIAVIEDWLVGHTTFDLNRQDMNVDGVSIPLIGRLGSRILDLYQVRQLQSNQNYFWTEILKYLIRTGHVSFDGNEQIIRVANSELDVRRILTVQTSPSPELIARLAKLLRSLNDIHFDSKTGALILDGTFLVPSEDVHELFLKHQQGQTLNADGLATLLLHICAYEEGQDGQSLILTLDDQVLQLTPASGTEDQPIQHREDEEDDSQADMSVLQWLSDNAQWSSDQGQTFLIRYRTMPNYLVRIGGDDGLRLSNLLHQQALELNDILHWHENHVQIDRTGNSLRMIIKPNNNIEIVNLPLEENEKKRAKVNEEKKRATNQKARNMFEDEEKNLVFFVPFRQQTPSDNDEVQEEEEGKEEEEVEKEVEREKEKENHNQHSTSPSLEREEQKKIKTNDDNDGRERVLLLESIASLLHFVNANGSNVGTLELIQGRRLRLSLTDNSPFSQQQQQLEFNEDDTRILCEDLDLDIETCTQHLVDHIFDKIEFDNDKQLITIHYRGQMLKLKNLKQKLFQPTAKKLRLTSNKNAERTPLTEDEVNHLSQWLDQLNREKSITITEQNDIVIFPRGEDDQEQQIFINHEDVDAYMENKINSSKPSDNPEVIGMNDIARILLLYNYVQYSDGQIIFGKQRIALDQSELLWLRSIIQGVRSDGENRETEIDLFDGEHTQIIHIPYEHMPPTNDPRLVADYLFRNGHVRYDADTGSYAYRYVQPDIPLDDEIDTTERVGQRQVLSSHIRHIHVDEENERVELEFLHDPNHRLELPSRWYRQAASHGFDRGYIIDMLLANGGLIEQDTFVFNGRTYSLQVPRIASTTLATDLPTVKLSNKQKQELIEQYVETISKQDGIKHDNTNNLLLLENQSDGSQLYFTPEHSDYIHQNKYRRQDVTRLLFKHGQIKQDEFGNWLLYYNDQYVQFPASIIPATTTTTTTTPSSSQNMSNVIRSLGQRFTRHRTNTGNDETDEQFRTRLAQETQAEFIERYHGTIEYMYRHGLITCNRRLKLVQIHFSNQTLTIPLDQLRAIVDTRILNSTSENVLPFQSRQLSQWLLNHSETISNTREGYIRLVHKGKTYDIPFINPNTRPAANQSALSPLVKRFGLTTRTVTLLSKIDLTTAENQIRCANHLLEKLDQFGSINIDNETRRLVLSMTPDNTQQLIIQNPVLPVTKQSLADYLVNHGRFTLNADRTDIEYRHFDDGRIYRFNNYIRDWDEALGETTEQRVIRILGEILSLNGRFLQRADRQIIISLRNGERFIIPSDVGSELRGPVNGQTIAELLVKFADDIYEEEDGKYLVIVLADQTLRLPQQKQLMSSKVTTSSTTGPSKSPVDPKLKLLFPFNKSLRDIQKTSSTSTLNVQPPDASNGYAIDPLLMLANYIYRAGSIYQDDFRRLVIKLNEDEIVVPRIEAINAIETINTSPHRTGTIVARLIDRIGKVQSNRAGGLIITIGRSSFELSKELIDRANQLHRETIDVDNEIPIQNQDSVQTGLNGSMTVTGRNTRQPGGPAILPLLRQSKSVGSLSTSTIGHPWFTDDQQVLYSKDGRGDARYLNLDNFPLAWQKEGHPHGVNCEVHALRNVAPYLDVLGYVENDQKKGVTINELTRIHPEMLTRAKLNDNPYLTKLENDRAQVQTTLCPKPRILVIPDDETMLSSDRKTRFYVQYMYENDAVLGADPAYVMMLPSRYPVRPTRPQLIAPHHYRDITLREAPVCVHKKGEGDVYFENLAQYLSSEHPDVSPRTVRRMLKLDKRDEYLEYLSNKMPADVAQRLLDESEEPPGEAAQRYVRIPTRTSGSRTNLPENEEDVDGDLDEYVIENDGRPRNVTPRTYYNISTGATDTYDDERQGVIYENTPMKSSGMTNIRGFGHRDVCTCARSFSNFVKYGLSFNLGRVNISGCMRVNSLIVTPFFWSFST